MTDLYFGLQYVDKRFGGVARTVASIAFTCQLLLYTGVVLYAPALALEATTGLSKTASIVGIGLVCTFYSSLGGIKAVLITDVFQSLLMLVAVVAVVITAAVQVGGIGEIWRIAEAGDRIEFDRYINSVDNTDYLYLIIVYPLSSQHLPRSNGSPYLVESSVRRLLHVPFFVRSKPSPSTKTTDYKVNSRD